MAQRTTTVASSVGLHARPAAVLAKAVAKTGHEVTLTAKGKTIDPKSLLSVIALSIGHGDEVTLDVTGDDAERVADELQALLESDLDA
ncbi:HPr family phosphocarrier protein [Okibacterium fritillariae]|jgi:phosphocarrier protein HPr|uniref:Phosphocarrier protein HPr n=1 Tax=Okibacterium fritillariae TaxID=123320 RepID=A0A1T5I985_9MICO|nr:HPr family phosphocarrier protein [Okibacterium fritillariae]SKC35744.1 phosphocarrier protein [Okibacterium fritillariae]